MQHFRSLARCAREPSKMLLRLTRFVSSYMKKLERLFGKLTPLRGVRCQRGAPRLLSLCEALRAGHPPRFRYFFARATR